ncbi:MAG: HAMP domain-containing histidine kinase [bacterium]|nr:HAMP domain-containing histidine kinase [bacterium]
MNQPQAAGKPARRFPRGDKPDQVTIQFQDLVARVGMINQIHTALRSTIQLDDIYSIILSTLVSRTTFDFSRVILLAWDDAKSHFRGLAALGANSRDEHRRIHDEIAEEERALAAMVKNLRDAQPARKEESLFSESLRELSSHSFWITTMQKYNEQNALLDTVRALEIPYHSGAVCPEAHRSCAFLRRVIESDGSPIIPPVELRAAGLPRVLTDLFPVDTLWSAIRTQKGVRLILAVDKIYQNEPFNQLDQLHVDWFVGQVALALENAEMYKDLESAYNSLRDLDRMKSNFLSTISHELRTPLTAITGYTQLLVSGRLGGLSAGQKEFLDRIRSHGDVLVGKVNDLIEIAELDAGLTLEMRLEAVDPLGAIMAVLPRVEIHRARKEAVIEPVVNRPVPHIRSNEDALQRIFFHLIDNAVKFGHPGGHVRIEFETLGGELHIRVIDDGIGISPNQLQKIFSAFYQVDNQLTRNYEGLGIGLAIIKKYLDLSEGRIHVESEPGRGSIFTVIYPLA